MKTFSLLLKSLDPKPSRQELEEISVEVPSVAKADCAGIVSDWFGIVVSGISIEDARLLQTALRSKGCATDVVGDDDIPALHPDIRCQRVALTKSQVILTNSMNRRQDRNKDELVFISAGMVSRNKLITRYKTVSETRETRYGNYTVPVERAVKCEETKTSFRVDFFFSTAPHRISLELDSDSVIFFGDRHVRLKNSTELLVLMVDLLAIVPPERTNRSLRELALDQVYPSMHGYEEELRWAFYRLGANS
ncbi:hypothetical protein ACFSSA_02860 [Luteolibacter algae]|uniref:Uncharacterized protein n=1 Tax=Luteolibacter algae TaxID=454151 RepID=A0ABW5D4H5_9BACT